jgi:hypothetical protein
MLVDYSRGPAARQGRIRPRRRLSPARLVPVFLCVCLFGLLSVAGCASQNTPPGPTSVSEAFRSAHPDSARPEALATVPATLPGLRRELSDRLPAAVPVVLPRRLPSGWGLAAPYISVGDGGALPNPEVWAAGYRTAFTDGDALFVVAVNPERLPGAGTWATSPVTIAGRAVEWRGDGETIVLATPLAEDWRAALIGVGVGRPRLEKIAASLYVP